jgi:phosphoribosyl-ATP pyrophosphohydrolase
MKPGLLLTLAFSLFIASCSNKEKTVTTVAADGTITETALPRGRFIVDDATTVSNIPQDPTTLNGINGQNDKPAKDPVKEKAADLKRRYKNLLVFHADDTMKVNKSYIATLILGKDQILADVKEEVLETSSTGKKNVKEDTTIEIGNTMKAVLKSMEDGIDKSFEIERLGDEDAAEKKITDKRKKLMWQWKIKPLTRGQQNLVLTISIREKDGEKVDLPVRKIDVLIFAEPESVMSKVGTFFEKNFQWMLATLLIPLFMGWYNARMRHKFDRRMAQERELRERQQATTYQQPQQPVTDTPKTNETTST